VISTLKIIVSRHLVFVVYLASLIWLFTAFSLFALEANRSGNDVPMLACFIAAFVIFYAAMWVTLERLLPPQYTSVIKGPGQVQLMRWQRFLFLALVALYAAIVVGHFVSIGYIPLLKTWDMTTETDISLIRQEGYFDLSGWYRYASDYAVKSLGPVLLLFAYWYRSRLFWVILIIGLSYALGLFARVLPVIFLLPLLIFMMLSKRWMQALLVILLLGGSVYLVTMAASPAIRDTSTLTTSIAAIKEDFSSSNMVEKGAIKEWMARDVEKPEKSWKSTSALYALYERAFLVPGQVIGQWFYFYGHPEVREHGCGYRPVATILACKYVPIPSKLYAAYYPDNYDAGMKGSLNAASFMFEYANFGPVGLLLSAIFSAALFIGIRLIYIGHPLALPLNAPLILVSMESSLLTAINSGAGWMLTTALFILFFRAKNYVK